MSEMDARKAMKTKSWSQEQGIDALILLSRFITAKEIGKLMFEKNLTPAIDLIEKQIE
ncbi:hypothetical protein [Parasediminibacterium sp. JCM 36343]|uniref:hypothetical protein n=1 Tax=Parasediminibacterium sp. JCM 36343 TaxID=3374279 RepID=UPI00397D9902